MKQRNYQTNCLPAGSFAGRAMAQALVIALATLFVLSLAAPAAAQVTTNFSTTEDGSITVGQFTSNSPSHANKSAVVNGTAHTYDYVAIKMTIEDTVAGTENYFFGQEG